jgi:class 3 adenylate cyclase
VRCIAEHRGKVAEMTGDGLLAEFARVVDGVQRAADIRTEWPFATATFRRNGASISTCRKRVHDKAV